MMESVDSTLMNDVIDRLKKQGLFDKFRKECMADVDTKPAYQNLTLRVQGAVEQFLSSQKWTPDLNKNQLRENLRRHLNDLHMLSVGVDRVVDQVVNPKIYKDFRPLIDKVICELLNIDYDQWLAKQNASKQWNQKNVSAENFNYSQRSSGTSFVGFTNVSNVHETNQRLGGGGGATSSYPNIPSLLDIKFQGPAYVSSSSALIDKPAPPILSHPSVPPPPMTLSMRHPAPHTPANVPIGIGPTVGTTSHLPPMPNIATLAASSTLVVAPPVQPPFSMLGTMAGVHAGPAGSRHINERVPLCPTKDRQSGIINDMPVVPYPPPSSSNYPMPYDFSSQQSGFYSMYNEASSFPSQLAAPFSKIPAENFTFGVGAADPIMSYVISRAQELMMNPPLPQVEVDRPPLPEEEDVNQPQMTKTARDREAKKKKVPTATLR